MDPVVPPCGALAVGDVVRGRTTEEYGTLWDVVRVLCGGLVRLPGAGRRVVGFGDGVGVVGARDEYVVSGFIMLK